jgi:hypothetical protein
MSSDPIPDDENPDDEGAIGVRTDFDPEEPIGEAVSEVIRKPTRTAGDLSQVADSSYGISTEDIARDLESVASRSRTATDTGLLEGLLRRVERIEQHLGISSKGTDE